MLYKNDVFLSFSSKDKDYVHPITQKLKSFGIRVFWSDESLKKSIGESFFGVIQKSLQESQNFILICSENSMASNWVRLEYETFFTEYYLKNTKQRRLILLTKEDYDLKKLPIFLKGIQLTKNLDNILSLIGRHDLNALLNENKILKENIDSLNKKILIYESNNLKFFEEKTKNLKMIKHLTDIKTSSDKIIIELEDKKNNTLKTLNDEIDFLKNENKVFSSKLNKSISMLNVENEKSNRSFSEKKKKEMNDLAKRMNYPRW